MGDPMCIESHFL